MPRLDLSGQVELREVQRLQGHTDRVWGLSWNPSDGSLASCSGDKTVRIWQRPQPSAPFDCTAVLEDIHTRTVRSCAWSPSGSALATTSFDATTAIWQKVGNDFECAASLEGHENEVKSVSWNSSESLLATCGRDKTIWIWEVLPGSEYEVVQRLEGHSQDVKMIQWHPFVDILVSVSYDNSIKIWAGDGDGEDWYCVQTISESSSGHSSTVWSVSFNSSGDKMVTCSDDLTVKIWGNTLMSSSLDASAVGSWEHLCTLSGNHDRTVFSVHWSRDGVIASGAADDSICLFAEAEEHTIEGSLYQRLLKKEKVHDMDVNAVQWNPKDPRMLASAGDDQIVKIWELAEL